jgi:prepilin peptidase CpaA
LIISPAGQPCCFFAFDWIGGGDAKLAAATAVWLGWSNIADYGLIASVLGAGLTLGIVWFRKYGMPSWLVQIPWVARLHDADNGVPYGVALAAAGLFLYPQSQIWQTVAAV